MRNFVSFVRAGLFLSVSAVALIYACVARLYFAIWGCYTLFLEFALDFVERSKHRESMFKRLISDVKPWAQFVGKWFENVQPNPGDSDWVFLLRLFALPPELSSLMGEVRKLSWRFLQVLLFLLREVPMICVKTILY